MYKDYLFNFNETDEEFLVEAKDMDEVWDIIDQYFERSEVTFLDVLPVEIGEAMGLDTY